MIHRDVQGSTEVARTNAVQESGARSAQEHVSKAFGGELCVLKHDSSHIGNQRMVTRQAEPLADQGRTATGPDNAFDSYRRGASMLPTHKAQLLSCDTGHPCTGHKMHPRVRGSGFPQGGDEHPMLA